MNKLDSIAAQRTDYQRREKVLSDEHKKNIDILTDQAKMRKMMVENDSDEQVERARIKTEGRIIDNARFEEEKLNKLKASTENMRKLMEAETQHFRDRKAEEVELVQQSQEERLNNLNEQFSKKGLEQQAQYEGRLDESSNKNQEELNKIKNNFALDLQDHTRRSAERLDTVDTNFKTRYQNNELKFQQALHEQEKIGLKDMEKLQNEQRLEKEESKMINEKEVQKSKAFYKQTLDSMRTEFEKTYKERQEYQRTFLEQLDAKNKAEIRQIVDDFSSKKDKLVDRMQDAFYRPTYLEPTVSDSGKNYVVHLPIPEHEKGLVQISGYDRRLKITMSREFAEQNTGVDGAEASSKRYETFSKELLVPEIVDARKITREWKSGNLVFVVPKK